MAIANSLATALDVDGHVWDGYRVSPQTLSSLMKGAVARSSCSHSCSICGLTIYRIYLMAHISSSHWQEFFAQISLLTRLEALLGIINACLPVIKPIFDRLRAFIWREPNELPLSTRSRHRHLTSEGDDPDATLTSFNPSSPPRIVLQRWRDSNNSNPDPPHGQPTEVNKSGGFQHVMPADGHSTPRNSHRPLSEAWARW